MFGLPFDTTIMAGIIGATATVVAVLLARLVSGTPATILIETQANEERKYLLADLTPTLKALRDRTYTFSGVSFSLHDVVRHSLHLIIAQYGPSTDESNERELYLILREIPAVRYQSAKCECDFTDRMNTIEAVVREGRHPFYRDIPDHPFRWDASNIYRRIFADLASLNVVSLHSWAVEGSVGQKFVLTQEGAAVAKAVALQKC